MRTLSTCVLRLMRVVMFQEFISPSMHRGFCYEIPSPFQVISHPSQFECRFAGDEGNSVHGNSGNEHDWGYSESVPLAIAQLPALDVTYDFGTSPSNILMKYSDISICKRTVYQTIILSFNTSQPFWCSSPYQSPFKEVIPLTHLPCTKWPPFRRRYFQMHFRE